MEAVLKQLRQKGGVEVLDSEFPSTRELNGAGAREKKYGQTRYFVVSLSTHIYVNCQPSAVRGQQEDFGLSENPFTDYRKPISIKTDNP